MEVARRVIHRIGYNKSSYKFDADSCGIFSAIHEQSADINRGVERAEAMSQGAGDQGMMFGYACNETDNYMPLSLDLSHLLLTELAVIRREASAMTYLRKGKVTSYLRPDSKSQVTIEYNERNEPVRVHTIVLSTQHDEFVTPADDSKEAQEAADRGDVADDLQRCETGVVASCDRTTARTGTNLVRRPVDFIGESYRQIRYRRASRGYGIDGSQDYRRHVWRQRWSRRWRIFGKGSLEGGPFGRIRHSSYCQEFGSGRGVGRDSVQVSYAIGVAEPVSVYVNTYGKSHVAMSDAEVARRVCEIFDMRPKAIEERLKLRNPIYEETAAYGHMEEKPQTVVKTFKSHYNPEPIVREVELFTWEKLDYVEVVKKAFGMA